MKFYFLQYLKKYWHKLVERFKVTKKVDEDVDADILKMYCEDNEEGC